MSVSIDGPPQVNDIARLGHRGESTYAATMGGIRLLADHADSAFLFAGTLSVIQPAADPDVVYDFLKKLGTPSMDFLLQDGNHDRLPAGKADFDSTEYGAWLIRLLDRYLADPDSGADSHVRRHAQAVLGRRRVAKRAKARTATASSSSRRTARCARTTR